MCAEADKRRSAFDFLAQGWYPVKHNREKSWPALNEQSRGSGSRQRSEVECKFGMVQ